MMEKKTLTEMLSQFAEAELVISSNVDASKYPQVPTDQHDQAGPFTERKPKPCYYLYFLFLFPVRVSSPCFTSFSRYKTLFPIR